MKLVQKQSPQTSYDINLSLSIDNVKDNKNYSSNLIRYEISVRISICDSKNIEEIFVEQENRGAIQPSLFNGEDRERVIQKNLDVIAPKEKSTNIRLYLQLTESEAGPFVFELPPFRSINLANQLISGRVEDDIMEQIIVFYNCDTASESIFKLLGDIDSWISISTHFQLLDAGARYSENIRDSITSDKTTGFLARQIAYPEKDTSFPINSMTELDQILSTCKRLEAIPDLSKYKVILFSFQFIKNEFFVSEFWKMETRFGIASNYWEGLPKENQMIAFLALSIAKKDYERARDIIKSWIGEGSEISDVDSYLEELKEQEADPDDWKPLLSASIDSDNHQLSYITSLFLRDFDKSMENYEVDFYLRESIAKARAEITERINLPLDAEVANYRYFSTRGQRFREENHPSKAIEEYRTALSKALEHLSNSDTPNLLSPFISIFWIQTLEADIKTKQNNYAGAIEIVKDGIDLIQSYEEKDKFSSEYYITRLRAYMFELEGDKSLNNQKLDKAETNYGKAIYNYSEIDREQEKAYLLKRNHLITSSLAEQQGDFEAAKQAHENAAELANKQTFANFNKSRANICIIKKHIANENWSKAKKLLSGIETRGGLPGVEANHLRLIMDVYDAYKDNELQDCGEVLNRLDSLNNIGEVANEFPFEYGHDYRPAIVNLLAAQRLNKIGVDEKLLDELVEVSLQAVLTPNRAKLEIDQWGIADIGLTEQWRYRFPTHIVRRYEEIQTKAEVAGEKTHNYSDEALGLLRLLEQTLEFAGDYFANKEYGSDWQLKFTDRPDGRLTLGNLRNFLGNKVMSGRVWQTDVCRLLDREIIGESDVVELRNQFGHDRKVVINQEEYNEVENRIDEILSRIASEIPLIGEIVGKHKLGAYRFRIHWENATKSCYISTSKQLDKSTLYHLSPEYDVSAKVINPNKEKIIECSSERAVNNLYDYLDD